MDQHPTTVRRAPRTPLQPPTPPRDRFDLDAVLVRRNPRLAFLLQEDPRD
jgi:hypothetical protein